MLLQQQRVAVGVLTQSKASPKYASLLETWLPLFEQVVIFESHTDVSPQPDRLLLFWSDLLVHEVLPSWGEGDEQHRYTFTVWLVTQNAAELVDRRGPLYPLRVMYFPTREEAT